MSEQTVPLDYVNSLAFDLQKAFWDERGKGARFRMTTVGRDYFQTRLAGIQGAELASIVPQVGAILQKEGIIGALAIEEDGRLLRLRVQGCLHRSVEEKMATSGIEPLACIPANIVVLTLEEKLNRPVELAEAKLVDGGCELTLILFDERPHLDGGTR